MVPHIALRSREALQICGAFVTKKEVPRNSCLVTVQCEVEKTKLTFLKRRIFERNKIFTHVYEKNWRFGRKIVK
jgi:hypothetical protein